MNYIEPSRLSEALKILAEDEEARCLAGGATLVAMMNADLLEPSTLVGLCGIKEMNGVATLMEHIRIGAMTSHAQIAVDAGLIGNASVVKDAAGQIAHSAIRNVGTIGGSICHADPNADFPGALCAANASLEVVSSSGTRIIPIGEFFLDYLETSLEEGEIVSAILIPRDPPAARGRHLKFSRTHGDYATVSISLVLAMDGEQCAYARVAAGSVGPTPLHLDEVDVLLQGSTLDQDLIKQAGDLLSKAADPVDDVRGSSQYRRMVIPGLLNRAISEVRAFT